MSDGNNNLQNEINGSQSETNTGSLSEYQIRLNKLSELRKNLIPYADKFERTHTLSAASELNETEEVRVCGRVVFKRGFGKFMFMKLQDINGILQISVAINELGEDKYNFIRDMVDTGDFVGASGEMYKTKTGEITVKTRDFVFLSKSLRQLPEKYHGIQDVDLRFRQRYLDLISNENAKNVFINRSKTISFIRRFLSENDFLEIETPILQDVASGAAARPFITKHNALDKDYFLRIAPELYLKQAVAGGFDRVFEIGKNFRNEGMDSSHLQEFTMLEWYAAYWDFNDNIKFSFKLINELIKSVHGNTTLEIEGHAVDFSKQWEMVDYCAEINKLIQGNILDFEDVEQLKKQISKYELLTGEELAKSPSIPALIDLLYKKRIRPNIIQPTVLYNYPACLIPLARRNDKDNRLIDMFQLVVCGWEIIKAYSELVDPVTQRDAFMQQAANKAMGDEESFEIDESFLLAMEHGMPPMSGLGLGIDRLVALLNNQSTLREVVLFPQTK